MAWQCQNTAVLSVEMLPHMGDLDYGRSKDLGKQLVKALLKFVLRTQWYNEEKPEATGQKPALSLYPQRREP